MSYKTFGREGQWTISEGPEIQEDTSGGKLCGTVFEVRVTVFPSKQANQHPKPGERDIRLNIYISVDHCRHFDSVRIPTITHERTYQWDQKLWEDGLAEIVASAIEAWGREHPEQGDTFAFVARRIRGEQKILKLRNNVCLMGNLSHREASSINNTVEIVGDIAREGTIKREVICAFRLPKTQWPANSANPPAELTQVHPSWCPRLAELVLGYIEELARYAEGNQRIQTHLRVIVARRGARIEWLSTVGRIRDNLTRIPEEQRPQLIEELVRLGSELEVVIV